MNRNRFLTVWIFQTGEPIHLDDANARGMRAMNLADALILKGHRVVLWTSDFDHFSKKSRFGKTTSVEYASSLRINLIPSRGYKAHKSLVRFWDHIQLAYNLRSMLREQTPPDVAFVGLPPVEAAWVMSRWLSKEKVPFLVDIKDAWPENYVEVFPYKMRFLGNLIFAPLFAMRNWTLRNSDGIVSITKEFLSWALNVSTTLSKKYDYVAPLVPSSNKYTRIQENQAEDWLDQNHIFNDGRTRAYFVGSLNSVFDFDPIYFAAKNSTIEFIICGDGPLRLSLENQFRGLSNVKFLGWVNQIQSDVLARRSTFSLSPLRNRNDFNMSIPNKFWDAIRLGKPIIASKHGLSAEFIKANGIGVCYESSDIESLMRCINELESSHKTLSEMSKASERLFQTTYNPTKVYEELVLQLEALNDEPTSLKSEKSSAKAKQFEIEKYNEFASKELEKGEALLAMQQPLEGIPVIHTPPFLKYIEQLNLLIKPHQSILELGAGTGKITSSLISLGADITAIDISEKSLEVLRARTKGKIKTMLADIEQLPFDDCTFDVVISSGSLSYGAPSKVDREIFRILKPKGSIIILDSLNHNPFYKLNRLIKVVRNERTKISIKTIPNLRRVDGLASLFKSSQVFYFGHYLWIYPFLRVFLPSEFTDQIMRRLSQVSGPRKLSFKFVLIGENLIK